MGGGPGLGGLPSEYTSVTMDGVSLASADANQGASGNARAFSFEQVSLGSMDSVEVSKTISADVDADAPAGTINLRSKSALDRKIVSPIVAERARAALLAASAASVEGRDGRARAQAANSRIARASSDRSSGTDGMVIRATGSGSSRTARTTSSCGASRSRVARRSCATTRSARSARCGRTTANT